MQFCVYQLSYNKPVKMVSNRDNQQYHILLEVQEWESKYAIGFSKMQ